MTNLATLYYYGIGISQNRDKALEFYGKAAGKGDERAKSCLAQLRLQSEQNSQTAQTTPPEPQQTPAKRQPLVVSKKKNNTPPAEVDDVDTDIPQSGRTNNTLFAVIFGNETKLLEVKHYITIHSVIRKFRVYKLTDTVIL